MKKVVAFFIQNQLLVFLGLILIAVMGVLLAMRMNTSFFPAQDEKFIIIESTYPGASPREIEEGITLKIEDNLKGVSGIDRVTSTSAENSANIRVELETDADADLVLQDVKNAVDQIPNFPEGMEQIVVYVQEIVNFTARLALVGDVSLKALEETADLVEDDLRALPEISKIEVYGYPEQEIEVAVQESKLRSYNLTFQELAQAISEQNIQVTGGRIRGKEETIIRSDHREYTANALLDVTLKVLDNGKKVKVRDVANIKDDWAESTNAGYFNDERAIFITVNTLNEENILKAADSIEEYVKEFNKRGGAIDLVLVEDGTTNLKDRISLLQENGIIGAILVFILLALFLRIRLAFWVAVGIPISFLGMFIVAYLTGITINVLSLFGMILVIGILVDDGIVVGENIFQHYERGKPRLQAVIDGTVEVMPSVVSAILTTCVAFSFFLFIDGQLGEFFSDVAIVVIAALGFSLIEVFLFLPAHLAHIKDLSDEAKPNKTKERVEQTLIQFRDKIFQPVADFVLEYKIFSFLIIAAMFIITIGAFSGGVIQAVFFPNIEQNKINISLELPAGTSEEVTQKNMEYILNHVRELNQEYTEKEGVEQKLIENIELKLGPQSNQGDATLYLVNSENRSIRSFEITADIRQKVGPIPRAEKLSFATQTPFGKPINISFSGNDYEKLRLVTEEFKEEIRKTGKVKDLVDNDKADQPELNLTLNDAGRALGFTEQALIGQVRSGFFGYEAQRLQRGDDEVKVWVRYALDDRKSVNDLERMRVVSPEGRRVAVGDIASIESKKGLIAINHRSGRREIAVEGEVASLEVNTPQLLANVRDSIIPPILSKYPGIDVSFEGQQRETAKLQKSVAQVGPVILVLILAILIVSFRSYSQAFALLMLLPFGLIGAAWGHFIHDQPMSILSFLGIIALIGVLLNDGLVYINTFNGYLQEGMEFDKALKETTMSRFRPLLLTTLTTSAGLGPLIFEKSFQAQFLIPMAISIAYGLILGSLLIVLLLPITLTFVNRVKVFATYLWEGTKPAVESVEEAIKRQKKEEVNV
ncbi:MAG TPA: efflux RND transporter permease subunit [Cryomorphaceae bacterium]|nr:efflux RND transporter permease subunit [Cryomorphaceae bacterium]